MPQDWKDANIVGLPINNKGKRSETGNYRPISLAFIACKVTNMIKNYTTVHLAECSMINDSQHEFTKGRSCLTNLLPVQ